MRPNGAADGAGLQHTYFRTLFEAVPSPVLIVDGDVRILACNAAAAELLVPEGEVRLLQRGGEAMHCLNAVGHPEGCGHADGCKECVVRDAVGKAFQGGTAIRRKASFLRSAGTGEAVTEAELLVTASPFHYEGTTLVLLILEDITELSQLRKIVPICAHCKKIRNDENFWESVEGYLRKHASLDFSHAICEACLKEHYGDVLRGKL